jgi:hypothetical protein
MVIERIEFLVTVKGYPAISQTHGEVVCVAGIRTDVTPHRWLRLFPVQFRDLEFSKRFQKYQFIQLDAQPHSNDPRPESFRPNPDSLELGKQIKTKKGWAERRSLIEPLMIESMCQLQSRQKVDGTSLGVFRPLEIDALTVEDAPPDWDSRKQAVVNQPSLLFPGKSGLEKIPHTFRYRYRCSDSSCPGHHQSIIDWEFAQSYRKWRDQYGEEQIIERLRARWLTEMWSGEKDSALFVGNMHQHPESFLVLGVFWPPKS